eukprot:GDKH01001706.1.p1 GENE.GDKH01001706.1~~GDKH01001706.1.p1  ORF type:complete len:54 (+),score=1.13 GDKH01001706.1:181-342(+)
MGAQTTDRSHSTIFRTIVVTERNLSATPHWTLSGGGKSPEDQGQGTVVWAKVS